MPDEPEVAEPPEHWEADVVLRDGRTARLRPIRPSDAERLAEFHRSLSEETIYYRFFAPYPELTPRDLTRFTTVDHHDRVAFVALTGDDIIGVGRFDRVDERDAEVAFVIRDAHQGRGLGSVLLEHLAAAARELGVRRFVAEVLPTNRRMLATFEEAGYHPSHKMEDGVVSLAFDLEPTESSVAVRLAREHRAESRSVAALVAPESLVVVGASRDPRSLGNRVLRHLLEGGYTGRLSAVNRAAVEEGVQVLGVPTYASVSEIPEPVTLALLAVPHDEVDAVVDDCAAARVRGLLVVASGYSESGPDGVARQRALVRKARGNGMRVIGPNALGIVNTDPAVSMNASLAPKLPGHAPIGFFSQSGALGGTILARAVRRGLGVSTFVSAGNRADVSGNDLLQYWEDDEQTSVVLLYLESVGNPRKFTRIARRLSRTKPVVAMRTGRSTQAYPIGHAIRRTTLPVAAVDSMFAQAGIVEVESLGEMFDVAGLLAYQPLPAGRRVAIVGNSDALAVLAGDACEGAELDVVGEPMTLRSDCTPQDLARALAAVLDDPAVDSVVVSHVPTLGHDGRAWERVVAETVVRGAKPVVAVLVAAEEESGLLATPEGEAADLAMPEHGSVPFYGTVEDAVRALRRVTRYAEWRARPLGDLPEFSDIDHKRARAIVDQLVGEELDSAEGPVPSLTGRGRAGGGPAATTNTAHVDDDPDEVVLYAEDPDDDLTLLLEQYGIPVWPVVAVTSAEQAVEVADRIGYPVVLKTLDPRFSSRTDLGGLRLNLENERAVRTAFRSMSLSLDPEAADRLVLQHMATPGVACVVGSTEDPLFGPVVSFGLAGMVPELLGDRGYRIPPLTDTDAHDLVDAPGASPMLNGIGGTEPVDHAAIEDLLLRVGQLADDVPELGDLRLEPVVVAEEGLAVLGARAVLRRPQARSDAEARRLGVGDL
ncbi:bifunctional acetate--CoA ligase family protein/GNAT family N-acetyltransferase [Longivirga aurantiaca]|uniref:GNAT family N-acetyltransferase n=1 Tax=Longivirga aurantiaca TaxID=1837743 RepID=A0ABW1T1T1_9ACTN